MNTGEDYGNCSSNQEDLDVVPLVVVAVRRRSTAAEVQVAAPTCSPLLYQLVSVDPITYYLPKKRTIYLILCYVYRYPPLSGQSLDTPMVIKAIRSKGSGDT